MSRLLLALEKRSLKAKLLLGFVSLMVIALIVGIDAILGQRRLGDEMQQMYEKELLGISAMKEARYDYAQIGRLVRQMTLARAMASLAPASLMRTMAPKLSLATIPGR